MNPPLEQCPMCTCTYMYMYLAEYKIFWTCIQDTLQKKEVNNEKMGLHVVYVKVSHDRTKPIRKLLQKVCKVLYIQRNCHRDSRVLMVCECGYIHDEKAWEYL